jgi:phosphate transport system substrate-binding protein
MGVLLGLLAAFPSPAGAPQVRIAGTGTGIAILNILGKRFEQLNPSAKILVLPSIGSSGGLRALADGKVDIACSSRPLTPEELAQGLQSHPFAKTPLVFAVQPSNPVNTLGLREIIAMYEGTTVAWPAGIPLRLVLRPKSESAHNLVAGLSPRMAEALAKAHARPGMIVAMTDQDNAAQLEKTPGCLGTSTLGLILAESRALKPLALNSVQPTLTNLAAGTYPYAIQLTLARRGDGAAHEVELFLRFLRSRDGKEILQKHGFLPSAPAPGEKP